MRRSEGGASGRDPGDRWPWPLRRPGAPIGVLAHRGGAGPHPENSLGAFADALRWGADGVELDVRLSADGVAVVHHDPVLPDGRALALVEAADLPAHVPSLVDALAVCAGAVVDVEVKGPSEPGGDSGGLVAEQTAELVAAALGAPGGPAAVLVTSFWPAAAAAVRAARPALATGLLVHPALDSASALDQAEDLGCTTLLPHCSQLSESLVAESHHRGLALVTWTVNEPAELERATAAGVDAIVTDHVVAALEALGRR